MLRTLSPRHPRRRRGAVLIVVLAMLVLFAVLGLSFVLYSEAQQSIASSAKQAVNTDSPPDALGSVEKWMGPFIYDVSNLGDDLMNPIRAHSLSRSKWSVVYDSNPASGTFGQFVPTYVPYNAANAIPQEPGGFTFNTITDSRQIVRHTWDTTSQSVFDPEWYYNGMGLRQGAGAYNTNLSTTVNGSPTPKNYPFTYPDRHDFYLAQMDPATGRITVPSFHRPDLGSWDPSAANYLGGATGRFKTLRPHPTEHPNFPTVPMDPDGQYRGDVSNMKFISATGGQQNDSLWMYAGGPVLRWRNKNYVACVAPLILDLNGRVNLSVAGNLRNTNNATTGLYPHGSKEGWGPWEINPRWIGNTNPTTLQAANNTNFTDTDLIALVQRRQGNNVNPPIDPYTQQASTTRINGGKMPWQGAMFNVDGNGPTTNDGPLTLPPPPPTYGGLPSGFQTTPFFNNPAATGPFRFSPTQVDVTTRLANHPAQFNPLAYNRPPLTPGLGAGSYGMDELIKLYARYSDPKNRQTTVTGMPNTTSLTPAADTAVARQMRALTTTFSTSQQWAGVTVYSRLTTDAVGVLNPVRLGPIDLNRPLPDYRKNPALPPSPLNLWNPSNGTEKPYWLAAQTARQRLARDIFIRMAARYGLIDGVNAIYYTDTGNVEVLPALDPATDTTGNAATLMRLAQTAVNLVDYIDGDDIVTPFVWRPTAASAKGVDPSNDANNYIDAAAASRVVYGTEVPRLVINEVYSGVFNTRDDPFTGNKATKPLKRRYWIELHNPTPGDAVRSDGGAARLRYQPGVNGTMVPDANGNSVAYPGVPYNPYRVEVAVAQPPSSSMAPVPPVTPYANALAVPLANITGGFGLAAGDTVAALTPSATTVMARIDNFAPSGGVLVNDEVNLVRPSDGSTVDGGNIGYYLLGPEDQFPSGGVKNSVSLPDPPAGIPPKPVNALTFDATTGIPAEDDIVDADITKPKAQTNRPSTVILRRLLNPYMPPNDPQNTGGTLDTRFPYDSTMPPNPYITVDFLENLPTRDRATHNNTSMHTSANLNAPSVGRIHPYAAFPNYGTPAALMLTGAVTAVQDQTGATTPPHTFFKTNAQTTIENTRGGVGNQTGFEWLVHLDRELVSLPEAAMTSRTSPALLTHAFFNGVPGTGYHGQAVGLSSNLSVRIKSSDSNLSTTNDVVRMLADNEGLLQIGSRLPGIPVGGREPGKVNLNTVNDPRVLAAVFDPQAGNSFASTNATYLSTLWATYFTPGALPTYPLITRTPYGTPRATVNEVPNPSTNVADYPFAWGMTSWGPTTYPGDLQPSRDHPFGRRANDDPANTLTPNPFVFPNYFAPPVLATGANHPYLLNEPLQKAWNNLTPVSDSFLIVMTVGFFEVENAGPWGVNNQPQLGKELFDKVPGDLRTQFAGVIDRSQLFTQIVQSDPTSGLALGTVNTVAADPSSNPVPRGVQTKMVNDSLVGSTTIDIEAIPPGGVRPDGVTVQNNQCAILGDGVVFTVTAGSQIRVGYGDSLAATTTPPPGDGEWLTVTAVTQRQWPDQNLALQNVPGQVTLTVAPTTRAHAAGTPVGNVVFGNPGPQPGVRLSDLQRRGVVPYFTRLDP